MRTRPALVLATIAAGFAALVAVPAGMVLAATAIEYGLIAALI